MPSNQNSSKNKWDSLAVYIAANPVVDFGGANGIFIVELADEYQERIFTNHIADLKSYILMHGSEITTEWIENNLETVDMFSGSDSYFIICAEQIPRDAKEKFKNSNFDMSDRRVVMITGHANDDFNEWASQVPGNFIKIPMPPFFKMDQLLEFIAREFELVLPYDVKQYLGDVLDTTDAGPYYNAMQILKVHSDCGEKLTVDLVREVILDSKLDFFKWSEAFAAKRFDAFYDFLANNDFSFDQYREFFGMMLNYVYKMYDTTYTNTKKTIKKYDQNIINLSRSWNKAHLLAAIEMFEKYLTMAKQKDPNLIVELRLKTIKNK